MITYTAARENLASTMDRVCNDHDPVIITPNDGLVDGIAFPTAAMPVPEDSCRNGINDDWEVANFGSIGINPDGDNDGDGLKNRKEYFFGLNPNNGASVNPITGQLDKVSASFIYQRRSELAGIDFTDLDFHGFGNMDQGQ